MINQIIILKMQKHLLLQTQQLQQDTNPKHEEINYL